MFYEQYVDGATLMNNIYDAPSTPTNSFFNKRTLLTNDSDSSANILHCISNMDDRSKYATFAMTSNKIGSGIIEYWNTSAVTNMSSLFANNDVSANYYDIIFPQEYIDLSNSTTYFNRFIGKLGYFKCDKYELHARLYKL